MKILYKNLKKIWYPEANSYLIKKIFRLSCIVVFVTFISFLFSNKLNEYYSDLEFNSRMLDRFTAKNDTLGIYVWLCNSAISKDLQRESGCRESEPPQDIIAQTSQYLLSLEKGIEDKYISTSEIATNMNDFNKQYETKKSFYTNKNRENREIFYIIIPFWERIQSICQIVTMILGVLLARYSYILSNFKKD